MESHETGNSLRTGRVLQLWLAEIPFVPLLTTYELTDRELGRGGYGKVIVGRKRRLPQQVAIKRIHAEFEFSEVHQRRFVREVQLLALLKHPNIVQVEDWGRDEEGLYIVMELIDGPNLYDLVQQKGRLAVEQVLDFTGQICRALQCTHEKGIVHRDLKPANLLVDSRGVVKLADFGLARESSDVRQRLPSSHGSELFTLAYASPEQLGGDQTVDGRSDLYSLGATLYHLATGQPDMSRVFDLDALPASHGILQPLLEALLRPNRDKRPAEAAAVLQMVEQATSQAAAAAGPVLPATSADTVEAAGRQLITAAIESSRVVGRCWQCGSSNPRDRKYCVDCGLALLESCLEAGCGIAIGVWERFCPHCGFNQQSHRQRLQQESEENVLCIRQHLQDLRYDLAESELQRQQAVLNTKRLQQLQPALQHLQTDCQEVRNAVATAVTQAVTAAERTNYGGALQILETIPTVFWPEPSQLWRQLNEEIRDLSEQLPPLEAGGRLDDLNRVLARLTELQPGQWPRQSSVSRCVTAILPQSQQLAEQGRQNDALTLLETVPSDDLTSESRQQLADWLNDLHTLQHQAASLAAAGDYKQALLLFEDYAPARRPAD